MPCLSAWHVARVFVRIFRHGIFKNVAHTFLLMWAQMKRRWHGCETQTSAPARSEKMIGKYCRRSGTASGWKQWYEVECVDDEHGGRLGMAINTRDAETRPVLSPPSCTLAGTAWVRAMDFGVDSHKYTVYLFQNLVQLDIPKWQSVQIQRDGKLYFLWMRGWWQWVRHGCNRYDTIRVFSMKPVVGV